MRQTLTLLALVLTTGCVSQYTATAGSAEMIVTPFPAERAIRLDSHSGEFACIDALYEAERTVSFMTDIRGDAEHQQAIETAQLFGVWDIDNDICTVYSIVGLEQFVPVHLSPLEVLDVRLDKALSVGNISSYEFSATERWVVFRR